MIQPYSREFFVPRPSKATLFFRTFVPWQVVRFAWINLKMIRMIGKAHSHRSPPPLPAEHRWATPERAAPAPGNG